MTRRCLISNLLSRLALLSLVVLPTLAATANTVVIYGASGRVGQVIVTEALARGHEVIGVSRNPASLTIDHANFSPVAGDVTILESMLEVIPGADAVIIAVGGVGPGNTPEEATVSLAAETFLQAAEQLGDSAPRVIQISGGSTLWVNGVWGLDNPSLEEGTARHGRFFGHWRAIETYRTSTDVAWTVMTPPPGAMTSGERTGNYRLGGDDVLFNAAGDSNISTEDFAVAIIDEVENPQSIGKRVTVGPPY